MKLLDLLNVIEDDTPIWIYIDHPIPCRKEGLFFGAVQFAAENDSEWFKVFRRRGLWYAYHCIGMDI